MAWITKNSGTMAVARRAEPYLTSPMRDDLRARVLPRYESVKGALLPVLNEVQHAHGWLPPQAMEEVAEFLGLPAADVLDTASFYEEYWMRPRGRHLVGVCRSIACEFCGQTELTQAIKERLGIEVGETTDDGRFTLIELECLGACGGAPAMLIDQTLHEDVKPADVGRLLDAVTDHHH